MAFRTALLVYSIGALAVMLPGCDVTKPVQPLTEPQKEVDGEAAESLADSIILADTDGSNPEPLTEGRRPAWSPDGQRIAFHRNGKIHVIHVDGSHETTLVKGTEPAWSPDGERIAFTSGDVTSGRQIAVMNSDGSGTPTLIRPDFRDGDFADLETLHVRKPAWSPDGERIAFERTVDFLGAFTQTYVMDADGSNARRLTPTDGRQHAESDPSWSPDGSRIVFWSFGYGIADVDLTRGVPRPLFTGNLTMGYGAKPVWSPDGTRIAFNANLRSDPEIHVVRIGGSQGVLIKEGRDAVWSPGGERLAFVSGPREVEAGADPSRDRNFKGVIPSGHR